MVIIGPQRLDRAKDQSKKWGSQIISCALFRVFLSDSAPATLITLASGQFCQIGYGSNQPLKGLSHKTTFTIRAILFAFAAPLLAQTVNVATAIIRAAFGPKL
jgi:hypothetical protein